ncbi:MAG: hypothetical protein WAV08_11430, partial [Desulfobacterales bacterium]
GSGCPGYFKNHHNFLRNYGSGVLATPVPATAGPDFFPFRWDRKMNTVRLDFPPVTHRNWGSQPHKKEPTT